MTLLRKTLLFTLLMCGLTVFGQSDRVAVDIINSGGKNHFNYYTSEDGLVGQIFETVFQDSKGRIWAGSREGVNILDGAGIQVITAEDGLPSNFMVGIDEAENGEIWLGTSGGLAIWNGFSLRSVEYADTSYKNKVIWSVGKSFDGSMIVGTAHGLFQEKNGKLVHKFDTDTSNAQANTARKLMLDSQGFLWVACWNNTFKINNKWQIVDTIKANVCMTLDEDLDGNVWLGAWGPNLVKYAPDGEQTIFDINTPVPGLAVDSKNKLWLGTWEEGLCEMINDTTVIRYGVEEGLGSTSIWGFAIDHEDRIWCGMFGGGICQLVDNRFALYSKVEGLAANFTNDITMDTLGNIWAAAEGGVSRLSPDGSIMTLTEVDGLDNTKCNDVMVKRDGSVWITLYGMPGLYEYNKGQLINHNRGGGFEIIEDRLGRMWVGSDGGGVSLLEPNGKNIRYYREKNPNGKARAMFIHEDDDGNVWLGAEKHSFHIVDTNGTFYEEVVPDYLRYYHGTRVGQDYKGYYWLGLVGKGLYRCSYKDGKAEIIDSLCIGRGLPSNKVNGLLIEDLDMWINTTKGMVHLDLASYYGSSEIKVNQYTSDNGFIGDGSGGIVRNNKGELVISSSKGLVIFREQNHRPLSSAPITNITKVLLNKKEVDWTEYTDELKSCTNVPQTVSLEHDQNHLTLDFIGISFSYPKAVRYQYILEGFDDDWSPETEIRQAVYSNIPPGEYTFKVRAMNKEGMWDESPDEIRIVIHPAYWQTTWFKLLVAVLAIAFLYAVYRLRTRKLQLDKKRLEERVEHRTAQLKEAFHEIEEKNNEITDSISYAKRIQTAILPPTSTVKDALGDCFVLYKPKDIVAGDFYWLNTVGDHVMFAVADCTGHGVPGAMVSVVCHNALNRAIREFKLTNPAQILDKVREIVIETFASSEEEVKDGMDIGVCSWNTKTNLLQFSGAHNGLYYIRQGELNEIRADKQPVGRFAYAKEFTCHELQLEKEDCLYLFSDGYADQFGGEKGKKFKYKPFKALLVDHHKDPMSSQKELLDKTFEDWRGSYEQIDDVCVLGLRI